jgi:hypothetical protein
MLVNLFRLLAFLLCSCRGKPQQNIPGQQPYECTHNEELEEHLDKAIFENDKVFLALYPLKNPFTDTQLEAVSALAARYEAGEFQPE